MGVTGVLGAGTWRPARLRVRPDLLLFSLPPLVPPDVQDEAVAAPCTRACADRARSSTCAGRAGSSELAPSGESGAFSPL